MKRLSILTVIASCIAQPFVAPLIGVTLIILSAGILYTAFKDSLK